MKNLFFRGLVFSFVFYSVYLGFTGLSENKEGWNEQTERLLKVCGVEGFSLNQRFEVFLGAQLIFGLIGVLGFSIGSTGSAVLLGIQYLLEYSKEIESKQIELNDKILLEIASKVGIMFSVLIANLSTDKGEIAVAEDVYQSKNAN